MTENLKKKGREQKEVGRVRRRRTKGTLENHGEKRVGKMIKARGGSQRTI